MIEQQGYFFATGWSIKCVCANKWLQSVSALFVGDFSNLDFSEYPHLSHPIKASLPILIDTLLLF